MEFSRHYGAMTNKKQTLSEDIVQHSGFEEVLSMIDENISASRTQCALKNLHEEECYRK